jgi:hypothetical protein
VDDADRPAVQAEKNIARVIAAKEPVFIIELSPFELLTELTLRAAHTQRSAGEEELVFILTKHGEILSTLNAASTGSFCPS